MDKVKIYVYRSFNASIGGKTQAFIEGESAEIPADYADDFVRAGYVGIVRDEPAVKVVRKPTTRSKKAVK